MRLVKVPLADVEHQIDSGWLAQYRGKGWIAGLIQHGTGGVHSHSALLRRINGSVDVLEVREFIGGRATPLVGQVQRFPGQIDIFSPDKARWPEFDCVGAAKAMRDITIRDYGWWGVIKLALRKIPLVWRLFRVDMDDDQGDTIPKQAPFCSHAVCTACRIGGKVDPVPRKPDCMVTPNDLTWSMFFKYEFTLVP